ncbi:hypothetical protein I3760_11G070400 [Carya illinoinensis]|nr:hypothetical protein I3760_11G070400 [Carya illinoinensis]
MADTEPDNIRHQNLLPEKNLENPSKFYSHFLCKALIVLVFVVVLPIFPSQAPEFINQTLLTRSWELLHLIFVGIAVSYGLFSRRNDETEKENNNSKFDNAHTYVSRWLEVSSDFDDEAESQSGSDESRVQTWSSQYRRNKPVVVLAQEHSVHAEQRSTSEKPLLLPVRSLKSRVPDPGVVDSANESETSGRCSGSISWSTSKPSSKGFSGHSNQTRNGGLGGLDPLELEARLMDNVVHPSPVSWRSRSGRLEIKEDVDSPTLYNLAPSFEESEFNRLKSRSSSSNQMTQSSRSSSNTSSKSSLSHSLSSARKLSPSPSFSAESQAKNAEDLVRKKSFFKSPPPPPPPPPPPLIRKSSSVRPNSTFVSDGVSLEKELRRSFTSEPKKLNKSVGESQVGRVNPEVKVKVRRIRASEAEAGAGGVTDFGEDAMNGNLEKGLKEAQLVGKSGWEIMGFDQTSSRTKRLRGEDFMEFSGKENEYFVDPLTMVSEENTESEDDDIGGSPSNGVGLNHKEAASSSFGDEGGGPDVDKKADEFIAKFREQIRLQRIESIKRSSGQIKRNSSR